jgi:hypothetical protein
MFPNIKKIKLQIMNYMRYIYIYILKNHKNFSINDYVQLSYVQCTLKEINNQFPHNNFLQNMMFNQIKYNIMLV